MESTFYFGRYVKDFIFQGWTTNTLEVFIVTCIGIGFLALILEAIKLLRAYLYSRANMNPLTYARTEQNLSERSPLVRPLLIPSTQTHMRNRKIKIHVGESLLHIVQIVLGYLLMLAVMSFNAWIGISVIVASGIGYFFLGTIISSFTYPSISRPAPQERRTTSSSYGAEETDGCSLHPSSHIENASSQHLQTDIHHAVET